MENTKKSTRVPPTELINLASHLICADTTEGKAAAREKLEVRFNYIAKVLHKKEELEEIIAEELKKAAGEGHDQTNLLSESAREKIKEEIISNFCPSSE